nr:MAG TPA: hypothetical protein [Caudoviricetes sp.]
MGRRKVLMYKLINPDIINNQLTQIADEIRKKN